MKPHVPRPFAIALLCALLSACAALGPGGTSSHSTLAKALSATDKVALLPIANYTDVPQAGLKVEALLDTALRQAGLQQLALYPATLNEESLFDPSDRKAQAEAEKWAKAQGMRYAISGVVNEWRYKVGVDGEPAVGLTLQLRDLKTDQVIYTAAGGRTGWSREALSAVGQKLTRELISGIRIDAAAR